MRDPLALNLKLITLQHSTRNQYIKNYSFDFDFAQAWGNCSVTMTCVSGHLTGVDFTPEYKNWSYPPPESLFNAPVITNVPEVCTDIYEMLIR